MKRGLTIRQAEVLAYIRERIATGLPPSIREIGDYFGFQYHAAADHIEALEAKGCLSRVRYAGRTLRLTHATGHPVCVDLASGVVSESGGNLGVAYRVTRDER